VNIKWVVKPGSNAYGGPVIAGGKVFIGTNNENPRNPKIKGDKGVVMCFDEKTGQFLWQAVHDKLPNQMENDFEKCGVASTPAVEGNRVYYVNNRCEIVCASTEAKAGTQEADILWHCDLIKELGVFPRQLAASSPLVAGELVFAVTGNGVDEDYKLPAPKAPSFVAVDRKTGKVVWHDNSPGANVMNGQWTNPAYAEINGKPQVIFPGGDGWLYAFEPNAGKLIWKFNCNPKKAQFKPGGRGPKSFFVATPVVYDNKVYIAVGQDPDANSGVGHLWCIDPSKTGASNIDLSPVDDNFDPKAAVNKNSGLVWHHGGAIVPRPDRGRDYYFGRTMSTCAIHDGLLYIGEFEGFLDCFGAKTGQKYWEHDMKTSAWGSPYWVDGKVYIGNEDGEVLIFAHGKQKKLLGKVETESPMAAAVKGAPVVANGVLYVMTDKHLLAIANK
jgi:outer membrane protein assembly factor BamB